MEEEKGGLSETVARLESTKERLQRQVDQLKSETGKYFLMYAAILLTSHF